MHKMFFYHLDLDTVGQPSLSPFNQPPGVTEQLANTI